MKACTWLLLGALVLVGCQSQSEPPVSLTPSAAPVSANLDWYNYMAPDGSFSVLFPKAPESVGKNATDLVLACPLDKQGSNLSLIRMALPQGLTAESLEKDPARFFGKQVQLVKAQKGEWKGLPMLDVEMQVGPNRCWVKMIFAAPRLYQLVALSAPGQDFAAPRQSFFSSLQLTAKN